MPVLSRLQDQPERYRRTFLQAYNAVALLSFPLAGLFLALSRPLVLVLLGANWEKVISIFAWFTIAAGYLPLYYASMSLLNTQGRGKDIMATSLNVLITTVISVAAGLPFGPAGVALAFACTGLLVRMPVQYYIAGRSGPVSTRDLWTVFLSYLPTWGAVFCATYLARRLVLHTSPFIQLCICRMLFYW